MTRDQIKKWEDEAHNYADHVTANDPDADWNAVFHERFAQLARTSAFDDCIDIVAMHGGSVEIEAAIRSRKDEE